MTKCEDITKRIYPLLISENFKYNSANRTHCAAGNRDLTAMRKTLVHAALRFKNPKA